MEVKAIQGISSSIQHAESLKKSDNHSEVKSYAQMDSPMSKNAAEAIKNNSMISFGERNRNSNMKKMVAAAAIAAATAGATTSCETYQGCVECDRKSQNIYVICGDCNNKTDSIKTVIKRDTLYLPGDTIYMPGDTIYMPGDTTIITKTDSVHFDDYPFHIADSLIAHCQNNGFKIDGPIPTDYNNHVVFLASACYSKYDQKMYQTHAVDDGGANTDKMATLITKVTNMRDPKNIKVSYIKSVVTDVPGKGIQFEYSMIPEDQVSKIEAKDPDWIPGAFDYRFLQSGKEIHTNLRNGTNRVTILNSKGEEEWKGDFKKGQLPQTFFHQTFARNPKTGEVYYDENGNPEVANYNFEQGQAITKYVTYKESESGRYGLDYDF